MTAINSAFRLYNHRLLRELDAASRNPEPFQMAAARFLLTHGAHTVFGKEHQFASIQTISEFQEQVPLFTYDKLEPYILRSLHGEKDVLWDRPIAWFARSSGTSSAKSKYIPLNWDSLHRCHYKGMQTILAHYVRLFPNSNLFRGKSLTLGGNRHIVKDANTPFCVGDLSAFLMANNPKISQHFTTPPKDIGLIPDFETKVDQVCDLILRQNLVSFSGVPSWNLILMRKALEKSGKSHLHQVWPHMELFMHGGISFAPYRAQYAQLFPLSQMHYLETYNASEGFFALQTDLNEPGMQLLPNLDTFYEFIPLSKLPEALAGSYTHFETLETVKTDTVYALVISTNAGLWRYLIGDTVKFTSTCPHKIIITGRTQLFINAFGEELMIDNAEKAISEACEASHALVGDYTVAPVFMEGTKKGAHQWLIEFEQAPADMALFTQELDKALIRHNSDYEAKRIETGTMAPPQITVLANGTFYRWMAQNDRLGGQCKVPRLWSDRKYIDPLLEISRSLHV